MYVSAKPLNIIRTRTCNCINLLGCANLSRIRVFCCFFSVFIPILLGSEERRTAEWRWKEKSRERERERRGERGEKEVTRNKLLYLSIFSTWTISDCTFTKFFSDIFPTTFAIFLLAVYAGMICPYTHTQKREFNRSKHFR